MDPVPYVIGGGAEHSPEVFRSALYNASGGAEGVAQAGDLKVKVMDPVGPGIRVNAGSGLILNRSAGGEGQTYSALRPASDGEVFDITPTSGAGSRHDLVILRVEDPQYAPWEPPDDYLDAQFVFVRIIENVPAGTVTAEELDLGYPAIALARLDIPSSTTNITGGMIIDLRQVARPQSKLLKVTAVPAGTETLTSATYITFPTEAAWEVFVPEWATRATITLLFGGAIGNEGAAYGYFRVKLGAEPTGESGWDVEVLPADVFMRLAIIGGGVIDIPPEDRGTVQDLVVQGVKTAGDADLLANTTSFISVDVLFTEEAV
jgi:hypothetical protein